VHPEISLNVPGTNYMFVAKPGGEAGYAIYLSLLSMQEHGGARPQIRKGSPRCGQDRGLKKVRNLFLNGSAGVKLKPKLLAPAAEERRSRAGSFPRTTLGRRSVPNFSLNGQYPRNSIAVI